jgi:hypothetical protein
VIRPEAAAVLARFRDALIGAAVLALGLYWGFFTGGGMLHWIGYAVALAGVALTFAGLQRARFAAGQGGPGVVQVVEGRIAYFGPHGGGIADVQALSRLILDPRTDPPHWILHRPGEPPLAIPLTAEGADTLFDAFATLPGLHTEAMLRHMQARGGDPVTVWQSVSARESTKRLH